MSMDEHDIEWRCHCGHTSPDYDKRCNGCGAWRYLEDEENEAERQGTQKLEDDFRRHWEGHVTQDDRDRDSLRDAGRGHLNQ